MRRTLALLVVAASALTAATPEMPRFRWENFTKSDGLPDDEVFNVCVDGDRANVLPGIDPAAM